jgi:nesprin-1
MKWLVQTLDSLTSNRSDQEATTEQRKLEQLITRYKNLIPTIEITMTKTDIYSRSYTYRKEVREVCTLLHKVRDQTIEMPSLESLESLRKALKHQETCLSQLEQQRANIVSMLQRGKDLLKDQHAPNFVSSEVQQLEINWNETYGQNIEILKSLKNSQKLWNTYDEQKDEILKLIAQAEEDLRQLESSTYYNTSQVSADLQHQQELSSFMRKTAINMVKNLHQTFSNLVKVTVPEKEPELKQEISNVEEKVHNLLEKVEERVEKLQVLQTQWNNFQSKIGELHNWTTQVAPQSIIDIKALVTSPEERVSKTEILYEQVHEKITTIKKIEEELKVLIKGKNYKYS